MALPYMLATATQLETITPEFTGIQYGADASQPMADFLISDVGLMDIPQDQRKNR